MGSLHPDWRSRIIPVLDAWGAVCDINWQTAYVAFRESDTEVGGKNCQTTILIGLEEPLMKRTLRFAIVSAMTALIALSQIASAQPGANKAGDPRVKTVLDKLGLKYEVNQDGDFKVGMEMQNGRTQLAWINSQTEKLGNIEIREIISPGYRSNGAIPEKVANQLLADSAQKKLGAWQVMSNGTTHVAVFVAKIESNGNPAVMEAALRLVLYSADEMEKALTGKDDF
ncbi:MAG: hypothetical protein NW220_22835 [Leptolyngbyaceae cyanobacterium bins.349]|nr:hypothetical protein [Leptolyngbyaceae cyanobacterium bins.349]